MGIPKKYEHIDFKPPKSVADAAARSLEWRKKNKGKGGLSTQQAAKEGVGSGVQRAVNLKNRDTISPSTIKRMKAFFDRHEKNKEVPRGKSPWEDSGRVAWETWGGNPGRAWANKVVRQMEAADRKEKAARKRTKKASHEHENQDYMSLQNLSEVHHKAFEAKKLIEECGCEGLPDWLEDKISSIADDIEEVHSYLEHKGRKEAKLRALVKSANMFDQQGKFSLADSIEKEILRIAEKERVPADRDTWAKALNKAKDKFEDFPSDASKEYAYKVYEEIGGKFTNKHRDLVPGGLADGMPDSAFPQEALEEGREVELEHTYNPQIANEIAKDHLTESEEYYELLEEMEKAFE